MVNVRLELRHRQDHDERESPCVSIATGEKKLIVIVESHQQVLEHIHAALRRQRRLCDWTMVHFDSHADLACPNDLPARLCYVPRGSSPTLYDHLESTTTGIAEWILPLVLAASLSRIDWIRPAASQVSTLSSFPSGSQVFNVGVWLPSDRTTQGTRPVSFLDLPDEARVKVDSPLPYYADDSISFAPDSRPYCQTEDLMFSQAVNLHVNEDVSNVPTVRGPWLLDVCLDYFHCLNPFWVELQELNSRFADALKHLVVDSVVFTNRADEYTCDYDRRCTLVSLFHLTLIQLLHETSSKTAPSDTQSDVVHSLLNFYTVPQMALDAISALQSALVSAQNTPDVTSRLIGLAVEALPYLTLPHDQHQQIEKRLHEFSSFLRRQKQETEAPTPFLTTIARSSRDGFVPEELVDQLQSSVTQLVHDTFCRCGRDLTSTASGGEPFSSTPSCAMVFAVDY